MKDGVGSENELIWHVGMLVGSPATRAVGDDADDIDERITKQD